MTRKHCFIEAIHSVQYYTKPSTQHSLQLKNRKRLYLTSSYRYKKQQNPRGRYFPDRISIFSPILQFSKTCLWTVARKARMSRAKQLPPKAYSQEETASAWTGRADAKISPQSWTKARTQVCIWGQLCWKETKSGPLKGGNPMAGRRGGMGRERPSRALWNPPLAIRPFLKRGKRNASSTCTCIKSAERPSRCHVCQGWVPDGDLGAASGSPRHGHP